MLLLGKMFVSIETTAYQKQKPTLFAVGFAIGSTLSKQPNTDSASLLPSTL